MRLIGLTGGYAAGKSLVASVLRRLGATVIDLDRLSRELCAPGGAGAAAVAEGFGPDALAADGGLDRQKMAARVFADEDQRRRLEAILHPLIREEALRRARDADPSAPVVIDGALLYEAGWHAALSPLLLVTAPEEERIRRGMARDRLTEEEVRCRLAAQWDDERKRALADHVIDNGGTPDETARQVERLWPLLAGITGESAPQSRANL